MYLPCILPTTTLLMWCRVSSVWHCGIPGSAAVCIGGSSQAAVAEGQAFQPVCCAGRQHRACQHQRLPPVPPGHSLPGRDLRLVPHVCSAVLRSLVQRSARLHLEVLVTHRLQTIYGLQRILGPISSAQLPPMSVLLTDRSADQQLSHSTEPMKPCRLLSLRTPANLA